VNHYIMPLVVALYDYQAHCQGNLQEKSLNTKSPALPFVSIVIPHYAGSEILRRCLHSIKVCTKGYAFETILVDNGSSDGSVKPETSEFRDVRVIRLPENVGFAPGCNRGIREAKGEYIVLLNDDAEVSEGWLEPIIELMESDRSIAACQPKILSSENRDTFEYSGAAGGMIDIFGLPFSKGRLFDHVEKDTGQFDNPTKVFWASGVAMFLRASALKETGLLDEFFVSYMEEIDLCWRFYLLGYIVAYVPQSVVYHKGGHTMERKSIPRMFYNHRNSLVMMLTNLSAKNLLWIFPTRLLLELGIAAGAAVRNRRRLAAQFPAYCSMLYHFPFILRKRREVQQTRRMPDSYVLSHQYWGFASLEYFILGRTMVANLRNYGKMMQKMNLPSSKPNGTEQG